MIVCINQITEKKYNSEIAIIFFLQGFSAAA